jgi:hypothetical protein
MRIGADTRWIEQPKGHFVALEAGLHPIEIAGEATGGHVNVPEPLRWSGLEVQAGPVPALALVRSRKP